jgi:hypothetical protein
VDAAQCETLHNPLANDVKLFTKLSTCQRDDFTAEEHQGVLLSRAGIDLVGANLVEVATAFDCGRCTSPLTAESDVRTVVSRRAAAGVKKTTGTSRSVQRLETYRCRDGRAQPVASAEETFCSTSWITDTVSEAIVYEGGERLTVSMRDGTNQRPSKIGAGNK